MKYLKTFEDLDYMGSDPIHRKKVWISKDDISEALFGMEVTSVEVINNGKPRIGNKFVKNNGELKSILESISEFFNAYVKFTFSDDGIRKLILYFNPKTKEYVGQGDEMRGAKNTYQLAFDKLFQNTFTTEPCFYYDTLKNAIGLDWDWDINIKYKSTSRFDKLKKLFTK